MGVHSRLSSVGLALLVTTTYSLEVSAQSSKGWLAKITGTYRGAIGNDDGLISAVTQFQLSKTGVLTGSYKMNEQGKWVPGTLSQCQALRLQVLQCTWNDKYGSGKLEMVFSQDFSKFDGVWDTKGSLANYVWVGSR